MHQRFSHSEPSWVSIWNLIQYMRKYFFTYELLTIQYIGDYLMDN